MSVKKVTECPMKKRLKVKDEKCKKCEFYNPKKWYSAQGEVEVFCSYIMNAEEKKRLK